MSQEFLKRIRPMQQNTTESAHGKIEHELFTGRTEVNGLTIDRPGTTHFENALWVEQTKSGYVFNLSILDLPAILDLGYKPFTLGLSGKEVPQFALTIEEYESFGLHEGVKVPTITFTVPVSKDTAVGQLAITRTYLENKKAITFTEADQRLEDKNDIHYAQLQNGLSFTKILHQRTQSRGGLSVFQVENFFMIRHKLNYDQKPVIH